MGLKNGMSLALVACCRLSCQRQVVDDEARTYFNTSLAHYVDSLSAQVCRLKYQHAPAVSGRLICPAPGAPGHPTPKSPKGSESDAKDSEVRRYIRYKLEPVLDSMAYQLCHLRFRIDPGGQGGEICPGPPDGYHKPPGNGAP